MPLRHLDHVNLCTGHLERMLAFYEDVLGMKRGPRPPFTFGGAWLYLGERPVVHLVAVAKPPEPCSFSVTEAMARPPIAQTTAVAPERRPSG